MNLYVRGYRGAGFGSKFIKWFTFGEFSHVSLVFDFKDVQHEIEAIQGRGVICHPPNKEGDFADLVAPLSEEQILTAHMIAAGYVGADYDWKGIYGFLVRKKRNSEFKWFCSELVAYVLYTAGYRLSRRHPYQETPSTVMQSLRLLEPSSEVGGA